MKIQAIKQFTNGMSASEEAAVILRENDNDLANLVWKRLVSHRDQMRTNELELTGKARTQRDELQKSVIAHECAHILAQSMGNTTWFWMQASKQTVGFKYVTGWE